MLPKSKFIRRNISLSVDFIIAKGAFVEVEFFFENQLARSTDWQLDC